MIRWPFRPAPPLGRLGEDRAARWLRRRGYRILARNLRLGVDEADLVALAPDRRTVVIVEVKTRMAGPTPPESAIGPRKRRRLLRLGRRLAGRAPYADRPLRIDVVAVEAGVRGRTVVRHHVGAVDVRG